MKIFIIVEVKQDEEKNTIISYRKQLHLFKDHAFAAAKQIGDQASVMEFEMVEAWNARQMEEEGYEE